MEAIIKLSPSELNLDFLQKIKDFLKDKTSPSITLTICDKEPYEEVLDRSIRNARQKNGLVTFTMEEFLDYDPAKSK